MPTGVCDPHMASIDFQIDRNALEEHGALRLTEESVGALSHLFLRMPITLVVGGVTILDRAEVPLIQMAYTALSVLKVLPKRGTDEVIIPGGSGLLLLMEGSDAVVTYVHTGSTGRESYSEVLKAWQDFSDRVRSFLVNEFPDFREHPQLGAWFREGSV